MPGHADGAARNGLANARLAEMAEAYMMFAGQERARFQVLFGAGLDKHRHPSVAAVTALPSPPRQRPPALP